MGAYEDIIRTANEVCDAVDDAILNQDFSGLSRTISGIAENASDAISAAGRQFSGLGGTARKNAGRSSKTPAAVRPEKYFVSPQSEKGPKILTVIGGALVVVFGMMTLLSSLISSLIGFGSGAAVVMGIMTAIGIAMSVFSHRAAKKRVRFKSYRNLLLPKLYADVSELAEATGYSEKEVVSDLTAYTREGMIKQGHFDDNKTCFIVSDELYSQYRDTADRAKVRQQQEAEQLKKSQAVDPAVREILTKGNEYIAAIHLANDRIPNEEITEKLNRMELIVRRIFDEVGKRPELAKNLNLFMTYYLPTTQKLMDAYIEMDRQEVAGENIQKAKKEISDSLSTICDAYEKLLDGFFKETAMDVSSDINVLKMMMKQEGLTDDDLTARRKKLEAEMHGASVQQTAGSTSSGFSQTLSQGGAQYQTAPETKQN
ncbi:MAG: 5-bromo-4-chloroindolyl phosphate hydrolysis family protein [Lachnospiraceae bacterium]|nr:5-bromo-4-chloroindolyl phosphate hydrolysis family protein [Lachnospiraceae bacterium]